MDHAARLAFGGDQVIPAARGRGAGGEAEHAVGEGVADVVVEEQPAVELLAAKFLLYRFEFHRGPLQDTRVVGRREGRGGARDVGDGAQARAASRSHSACASPSISISLVRLVAPVTMRTRERGTPASSAKKRTHSSLALPSTGGAARSSFQASPSRPVRAVRLARGWTFTVKRAIPPWLAGWRRRRPRGYPRRRKRRRRRASRGWSRRGSGWRR